MVAAVSFASESVMDERFEGRVMCTPEQSLQFHEVPGVR